MLGERKKNSERGCDVIPKLEHACCHGNHLEEWIRPSIPPGCSLPEVHGEVSSSCCGCGCGLSPPRNKLLIHSSHQRLASCGYVSRKILPIILSKFKLKNVISYIKKITNLSSLCDTNCEYIIWP